MIIKPQTAGYLTTALFGAALIGGLAGSAAAEMPSSKSTIGMSGAAMVVMTQGSAHELTPLTTQIKVPQGKELILDLSLECGLFTRTLAKSKRGNKDTSVAEASVRVNVLYKHEDEAEWHYAYPGGNSNGVVFCSRMQELSATFQGIFETGEDIEMFRVDVDNNGDSDEGLIVAECDAGDECSPITVVGTCLIQGESGTVYLDTECLTEEEVELVLDTMSANSFNFVALDLTSGIYDVKVVADIDTCVGVQRDDNGDCVENGNENAEALATVGRGSLDIDERRFIQNLVVMP